MTIQPWLRSYRADPWARRLADRHYNRQKVGAAQFVPPGRCLVLATECDGALWVTSYPFPQYVLHDWPGALVNSLFRRERGPVASDLIRAAVGATAAVWTPPPLGMVTFIDPTKVRRKRDPGRCYLRAGFRKVGTTKGGLIVLQLLPDDFPDPLPAREVQPPLWEVSA